MTLPPCIHAEKSSNEHNTLNILIFKPIFDFSTVPKYKVFFT